MATITFDDLDRLADALIGTHDPVWRGLEKIGINPDGLDEAAITAELHRDDVDRCRDCQRWDDASMLYDPDGDHEGYCDDCRKIRFADDDD